MIQALRNLACRMFGHFPEDFHFEGKDMICSCFTCKSRLAWNPTTDNWDILPPK